jgi:hypothetical protein
VLRRLSMEYGKPQFLYRSTAINILQRNRRHPECQPGVERMTSQCEFNVMHVRRQYTCSVAQLHSKETKIILNIDYFNRKNGHKLTSKTFKLRSAVCNIAACCSNETTSRCFSQRTGSRRWSPDDPLVPAVSPTISCRAVENSHSEMRFVGSTRENKLSSCSISSRCRSTAEIAGVVPSSRQKSDCSSSAESPSERFSAWCSLEEYSLMVYTGASMDCTSSLTSFTPAVNLPNKTTARNISKQNTNADNNQ